MGPSVRVWNADRRTIDRYALLFTSYLDGRLTDEQFTADFLDEWKRDRDGGVTTGEVIDGIMIAVDCFWPDPLPNDPLAIGVDELRREVADALVKLRAP